jgi:hypothetical protein
MHNEFLIKYSFTLKNQMYNILQTRLYYKLQIGYSFSSLFAGVPLMSFSIHEYQIHFSFSFLYKSIFPFLGIFAVFTHLKNPVIIKTANTDIGNNEGRLLPAVNFINVFTYKFFIRTLFWQLFLVTFWL